MPNTAKSIFLTLMLLLLLAACGQAETPPDTATEEPETTGGLQAAAEEATEPAEEATPVQPSPEPTSAEPAAPEEPATSAESSPTPAESLEAEDSYPAPAAADAATNSEAPDSYPAPAEEEENTAAETESAEPRQFVISPADSSVSYVVAETFFEGAQDQLGIEAGLVDTIGSTSAIDGQLLLTFGETVELAPGSSFEVDISTLTSDQRRRDNTIRDRFLESASYPLATFTPTAIENFPTPYREGSEVNFQLIGDLTIRETTQEVTFDVTATLEDGTITATAVAPLTMSDFGVTPPSFAGLFSVEDDFQLALDVVLNEQ